MKRVGILIALFILISLILFMLLSEKSAAEILDKTYSIEKLSYNVSSNWAYENEDGSNYHYFEDGGILFASSNNLSIMAYVKKDKYEYLNDPYEGFTEELPGFSEISQSYDAANNIFTASCSGDLGDGKRFLNFYATVNEDKLYSIILMGKSYSERQQNKLFNQIISTIVFDETSADQITDTEAAESETEPEMTGLGITQDEIIGFLERRLSKNNYPTISQAAYHESEIALGDTHFIKCGKYALIEGVDFYFLADGETNELKQFTFYVDRSKLSTEDYKLLGYLNGSLPFLFEPDTYEDLDGKLAMSSEAEKLETSAAGENRGYYFGKDNSVSYFSVVPAPGDVITLDQLGLLTEANAAAEATEQEAAPPVQENNAVQETQSKTTEATKPVASKPTFTGGLCTDINTSTGMPASIVSEFHSSDDLVILAGEISGISGEQNLIVSWNFPDGDSNATKWHYFVNGDTSNTGYKVDEIGIGPGSVSVTLESTGQVLATYYFTVAE